MTIQEHKQLLRIEMRLRKNQHTSEELAEKSRQAIARLIANPTFQAAKTVMLYHSLPDEVNTHLLIEQVRLEKTIILPTVVGNDIIPVALTPETPFSCGSFNIQEPQSNAYTGAIDLIVVPGVAFDAQGNRLGRGRGYYDRFLKNYPNVETIGLCFNFQLVERVPVEEFDRVLSEVITND